MLTQRLTHFWFRNVFNVHHISLTAILNSFTTKDEPGTTVYNAFKVFDKLLNGAFITEPVNGVPISDVGFELGVNTSDFTYKLIANGSVTETLVEQSTVFERSGSDVTWSKHIKGKKKNLLSFTGPDQLLIGKINAHGLTYKGLSLQRMFPTFLFYDTFIGQEQLDATSHIVQCMKRIGSDITHVERNGIGYVLYYGQRKILLMDAPSQERNRFYLANFLVHARKFYNPYICIDDLDLMLRDITPVMNYCLDNKINYVFTM